MRIINFRRILDVIDSLKHNLKAQVFFTFQTLLNSIIVLNPTDLQMFWQYFELFPRSKKYNHTVYTYRIFCWPYHVVVVSTFWQFDNIQHRRSTKVNAVLFPQQFSPLYYYTGLFSCNYITDPKLRAHEGIFVKF